MPNIHVDTSSLHKTFGEHPHGGVHQKFCAEMMYLQQSYECYTLCRFVSEQMDRISQGEDKETAAHGALQALRSEGVDIKRREVKYYDLSEVQDLSGCGQVGCCMCVYEVCMCSSFIEPKTIYITSHIALTLNLNLSINFSIYNSLALQCLGVLQVEKPGTDDEKTRKKSPSSLQALQTLLQQLRAKQKQHNSL